MGEFGGDFAHTTGGVGMDRMKAVSYRSFAGWLCFSPPITG
jgi:hypothetical protein